MRWKPICKVHASGVALVKVAQGATLSSFPLMPLPSKVALVKLLGFGGLVLGNHLS